MTETTFSDAGLAEIDSVMQKAGKAFHFYRKHTGEQRAKFLEVIASEIELLGDNLIRVASTETHLDEARLKTERVRTTGHLRMFAALIREGSWVDASIDTAIPDRVPYPRPDIRKMMVPLGPVVVFGAGNFPLAYSTAGGDTVSALAAGCTVVVKAHPAHANTSQLVADAIFRAAEKTGVPEHTFQHVHGASFEIGKSLVTHPLTEAVGFTGSLTGGKALFDLANAREKPIPVFAEMGSLNPVFILPQALEKDAEKIAEKFCRSITTNMGQFCTCPGLMFAQEGAHLSNYVSILGKKIANTLPQSMLHGGIASNYRTSRATALAQQDVRVEAASFSSAQELEGIPTIASVPADTFINNPLLHQEVFGPFSLIIKCSNSAQMLKAVSKLEGQLAAAVIGTEDDLKNYKELIEAIQDIAGRVVINSPPTGVEVCPSMHHGGPYPATTNAHFTSVGTSAIKRFARPLCFQNFPDELLPDELKNANPKTIWRLVNGQWGKESC